MTIDAGPRQQPGLTSSDLPAWLWLLPLVAILAWLPGVSSAALFDPDEGRNASIAREMADHGEFWLPRLNGLPFLDKPFLFFASQALAIRAIGPTELATRLPSLVAGALLVLVTGAFARRLWGGFAGWIAALACATSLLTVVFVRIASFDAVLTLFTTIALCAFYLAIESATGEDRRRWQLLAWSAIALGILTKGPIALFLPLGVAGAYAAWRRRGRVLWSVASLSLAAVLVAPWIVATERGVPGFLRYALVEETWARLTTDRFQRTGPIWYFLPILTVGSFPWILPAAREIAGVWRRRAQVRSTGDASAFAAIWLLAPLVLLSISQSKRPQYMLPLLPAVALLAAKRWKGAEAAEDRWAAGLEVIAGALLVVLASPLSEGLRGRDPALADPALALARPFGPALVIAGIAAWCLRRWRWAGLTALAVPAILLPLLAAPLVRAVAEGRSSRALVRALAPELAKDPTVIGINTFVPSLRFYLGRNIVLSAETPTSLTSRSMVYFADELEKAHPEVLRPPDWWQERLRSDAGDGLFLLLPGREAEPPILEAAGLSQLFANPRVLVYGRAPGGLR